MSFLIAPIVMALSDAVPMQDDINGNAGTDSKAARASHQHPTNITKYTVVLDNTGRAPLVFDKPFDVRPAVICGYFETADGQPVIAKAESFTVNAGGKFVSCVIRAYRLSILPAVLGSLFGFNVSSGSANGAVVDVMVS